jgi:hypothetical protein
MIRVGTARRAGEGTGPIVVRTVLELDRPEMRWEGDSFVLVAGAEELRVVLDDDTAFPQRELRARWRELRDHVAAPQLDLDADRKVRMRGFWISEGETVAVEGVAKDGVVRAQAIGAGAHAKAEAEHAKAAHDAIEAGDTSRVAGAFDKLMNLLGRFGRRPPRLKR